MNELSLFNSLFDDALGFPFPDYRKSRNYGVPKVDVKETKDAYTLAMDLPGRTESDVDISLKDSVLTIASRKEEAAEEKKDDGRWLIRERHSSSFSRSFTLPDDVNAEGIAATFKNGVLTVSLPRSKPVNETKKIAITAAE